MKPFALLLIAMAIAVAGADHLLRLHYQLGHPACVHGPWEQYQQN